MTAEMARDKRDYPIQVLKFGGTDTVAVTNSSAQSNTLSGGVYRIVCDENCFV